jgi:subtilase family serine protease
MTKNSWLKAALGVVVMTVGAGVAHAQGMGPVERSGHTYHRAVCAHNNGQGEARCHAHVVTDAAGNERDGQASPNATPSGYGPGDLRTAYNVVIDPTATGTIAIVDAYGYSSAQSDLAVYRSTFGLPPCGAGCFTKVNQNGQTFNYPRSNTGWAQEQALDLDMASAMCPNCKILLVEASSASYASLATAVMTAARLGANVISNSYGGGESGSSVYASAYDHPGIAVTASTGDSGYGVEFPASAPGTIAVGGTHLAVSGGNWTETAWSGGGSGCSKVYSIPSWQSQSITGCAMRMESDISAVADPATGVAVYGPNSSGRSAWLVFGGTSVAAPLVGGIYANDKVQPTAASHIWGTQTSGKNDVTSGSNGSCGGSLQCTAGPGYDGPTGWGTPNGNSGL